MNPLNPRITIAWRLVGTLTALFLALLALILETLLLVPSGTTLIFTGLPATLVAALGTFIALTWPTLRYRYWRWSIEEDRVLIQKGVIWRTRSLIPRVRIQHVDTRSSPLQRWLGLASLIIYTAGTRGADVEIPGLEAQRAEAIREGLARLEELDERA